MEKFEGLSKKYAEEGWLIPEADLTFGRVLGRGASGTTYMGSLRGEDVAIKAYSVSILRNDAVSVKNEMDIMARVKHENIVAFRGLCLSMDPPAAALVTVFATGGELGDALYKKHSIRKGGDAARYKVAIGLARGLRFLHANGLIHRDIKPANVLLDANGEPLLTDFGFSRMVDVSGDMTGETGSYLYMAPEVVRHTTYSAKADTFSYAVLVNEIFSDERPYGHLLPMHAAIGVVKKDLRPSQKRIHNPQLRALLAACWDVSPDKRPDWDTIISTLEGLRDAGAAPDGKARRIGVRASGRLQSLGSGNSSSSSSSSGVSRLLRKLAVSGPADSKRA